MGVLIRVCKSLIPFQLSYIRELVHIYIGLISGSVTVFLFFSRQQFYYRCRQHPFFFSECLCETPPWDQNDAEPLECLFVIFASSVVSVYCSVIPLLYFKT